jgi:hypothetical protein
MGRRGRRREPLEGVAAPGIVPGAGAAADAEVGVDEREDDPGRDYERADRGQQVERVEPVGRVDASLGSKYL